MDRDISSGQRLAVQPQHFAYARQLHGDVTRANDGNAFRQSRQLKETVGVDTVFRTRNSRMAWTPPGGDQDMIGSDRFTVDFDRLRIDKAGKRAGNRYEYI